MPVAGEIVDTIENEYVRIHGIHLSVNEFRLCHAFRMMVVDTNCLFIVYSTRRYYAEKHTGIREVGSMIDI
jgi:hypothetical protein